MIAGVVQFKQEKLIVVTAMNRKQPLKALTGVSKKTPVAAGSPAPRVRAPKPVAAIRLRPAGRKIGEGPGNLQARAAAFKRRRGSV